MVVVVRLVARGCSSWAGNDGGGSGRCGCDLGGCGMGGSVGWGCDGEGGGEGCEEPR